MTMPLPEHFPYHHLATVHHVGQSGPIPSVCGIPREISQMKNPSRTMAVCLPNFAQAYDGARDSSPVAAPSGLYTVETRMIPDGSAEATMMFAEAEYVTTK